MLGGLTIGEVLHLLEDRHQGEARGRPARLAAHPVGARELLIGQPPAELVAHQHRQRTLALALVHRGDVRSDLRCGLRPRLRHDRHHNTPVCGLHGGRVTRGKKTAARSCWTQDPKWARPRRARSDSHGINHQGHVSCQNWRNGWWGAPGDRTLNTRVKRSPLRRPGCAACTDRAVNCSQCPHCTRIGARVIPRIIPRAIPCSRDAE